MEAFLPGAPLDISSILELLERNAQKYPKKEAVISVDPHTLKFSILTHPDLKNLSLQTATLLSNLGIKKGDKFAILMHNCAEVLLFELAGALIGATTVPLDLKRDTPERINYKLQETKAKILFTKSWKDFSAFKKLLPRAKVEINNGLDTDYVILYTSGTTNTPKGVPLTINSCLLNAMGIAVWQKMTDQERFNVVLPLHHINSTIFCLSVLLKGGAVILNSVYSATKFWTVVSKFKATNTSIVPTILHDLLARRDEPRPKNSSLKNICIGSAPVLPDQTLKFYKTFKIRVTQGYGQTETALRVSGVPVDLPEKEYLKILKSNSIGRPLANNKLAIIKGEICVYGPTLSKGYLNNPGATKEAFKDGWFHSGDLGYFTKPYYFIFGRIKEIIIKGGINISPSAVEDVLLKAFPQIKEVSVVGFPDERMGEEIAAVIVIKEGYDKNELKSSILEGKNLLKLISPYELPKKVFFFEELPKTSTGKIQRVEAKSWVAKFILEERKLNVRMINPDETDILKSAVLINNEGFKDVQADLDEFRQRAKNGKLFGVFNGLEELLGSLSCVRLKMDDLEKIKTWNEATAKGTLKNNDFSGDALVCVAISVKRHFKEVPAEKKIEESLAKEKIEEYVKSRKDYVLNFHAKSKGGLPGATVWKILEKGRKKDKESMGYNVLLKYPEIKQKIIKTPNASPSVMLIEEAMVTAKEYGIKYVIAFSRPGGFRKYLLSILQQEF